MGKIRFVCAYVVRSSISQLVDDISATHINDIAFVLCVELFVLCGQSGYIYACLHVFVYTYKLFRAALAQNTLNFE